MQLYTKYIFEFVVDLACVVGIRAFLPITTDSW